MKILSYNIYGIKNTKEEIDKIYEKENNKIKKVKTYSKMEN